jgi:hypothetical protein
MRLIVLALVLASVAPADAANRPHRRRHASKAVRQALRGAGRKPSSQGPLGAPGDGHQLVVERGKLRLDGRPVPSLTPTVLTLSWSAPAMLEPAPTRGVLGTELPPPLVLARW